MGIGESFKYFQCANCRCLQIFRYPEDLHKYYPPDYYSYSKSLRPKKASVVNGIFYRALSHHITGYRKNSAGWILSRVFGPGTLEKIEESHVRFNDKILEIGSGTGGNLIRLYKYGFRNLRGIDPFIEKDIDYNSSLKVFKKSIFDFSENEFDLVFLNHSLEHMTAQQNVLKRIAEVIKPDGIIIVAVPIIDGFTWRRYKTNWVGLDAPRHLYIHSETSMNILCDSAGLKIDQIRYRTPAFNFWASEQYMKGIPLQDERSYYYSKNSDMFSRSTMNAFKKEGKRLDRIRDGSTARFYLRKR
jgi:SAM-dependent methyltransferase